MQQTAKNQNRKPKILIIRLSAAGDVVLTMPAFFYLRQIFPASKIDWVIDERFNGLLDILPGINRKIIFPGKSLKSKTLSFFSKLSILKKFIGELRSEKYDMVFDFQGLFKSGLISYLSRSVIRAGFRPGGHDSREFNHIFQNKIVTVNEHETDCELPLKILNRAILLCARASENKFAMPAVNLNIPGQFIDKIKLSLNEAKSSFNYDKVIVINPFTNWPTKTWPVENWAGLINELRKNDKLKKALFVLLWGPSEKKSSEKIIEMSCSDGVILSPETSLNEVFAVIELSDLVISGDSFALHAGFISGKKTVALFGASEPSRCAPFGSNTSTVTLSLPCQHCFKKICKFKTNECIEKLPIDMVKDAVLKII